MIVARLALPEDRGRAPDARRPADDLGTESPPRVNYFNYFTEIEEHFQRARGTGLFLLSPLDWALIESWNNAGVPLEAVLRGIDAAFEKWRGRKVKTQMVNSLAFCAQAVLTEAQVMAGAARGRRRSSGAAVSAWRNCARTGDQRRRAAGGVRRDRGVAAPAGRRGGAHYADLEATGAAPHRAGREDDRASRAPARPRRSCWNRGANWTGSYARIAAR